VNWADTSGRSRQFVAWRLVGEGSRSAWEWLEGQGLTCTTEFARDEDPRTVRADRMRLSFEGGQATTAVASDDVRVEAGDQWAEGAELAVSLHARTFRLQPQPGKRVALGGPEGLSWSDRLEGSEGGDVSARGQVTGSLEREAGSARTQAPIRFAADAATSGNGGGHLILQGDARLWQEDRLVRADRLDFDRPRDVVTGEGSVFTSGRTSPANGTPETVEVRARHLRYDRRAGVATYEGDVQLEDRNSEASCQSLQADLDVSGNIEVADLDGGVTINDRASARVISGQKARLLVRESLFEIWGTPVLVKEADGNQVKADHLKWNRLTNTVVVMGGEENPSETLYHSRRGSPTPVPRRRP
jgi:lipopolysaccharide export system protein LptA